MFRCSNLILFQNQCWVVCAMLLVLPSQLLGQQKDLDARRLKEINPDIPIASDVELQLVIDAGLTVYSGDHLILFSDIRDADKAYDLIRSYDAAVPQWCQYFGIDVKRAAGWKLRAFLLQGPNQTQRFEQAKLFTEKLPPFAAGYN